MDKEWGGWWSQIHPRSPPPTMLPVIPQPPRPQGKRGPAWRHPPPSGGATLAPSKLRRAGNTVQNPYSRPTLGVHRTLESSVSVTRCARFGARGDVYYSSYA